MTVVYGHVIHSLRRQSATLSIQGVQAPVHPVQIEQIDELKTQIAELAIVVSQVHLSMSNFTQNSEHVQPAAQTYTDVYADIQAVSVKIDSVHTPVHVLNLLNQTVDDEQEVSSEQLVSEGVAQSEEQANSDDVSTDKSTSEADAPLIYPFVPGISEEVVKQIIDLHVEGVAWSAIAAKLSKNYSRIVKPVRDAYTQANGNIDTDRHPVHINLYRQAMI